MQPLVAGVDSTQRPSTSSAVTDDAPHVQSSAGGACSAPAPAIGKTSARKQQKDNAARRI